MPLIKSKSKQALKKNIETEMKANPDSESRDQNLAIAYDVQRRAKAKKHADGGMIPIKKENYAEGGEVEEHYSSIADAILAKKRTANEQADIVDNSEEDSNNEDDMSYNALHRPIYDEEDAIKDMDQPEDSNEHGDELSDADSHDMVDTIRRSLKLKRSK